VTRVLYVVTGLSTGGAEMMLFKLIRAMDRARFLPVVVSLIDKGTLGERIEALGVPVHALGMSRSVASVSRLRLLARLIIEIRPDIVQGWMYHANLVASAAAALARSPASVLWGVRASLDGHENERRSTAAVIRIGAWVSRITNGIVYNSRTSACQHELLGYARTRTHVIPNGFDCAEFHPDETAGPALRAELGIGPETLLVGCLGRFHPVKDHETFMDAAGRALQKDRRLHFVLAGGGVDSANMALAKAIERHGLSGHVHLLGERRDVPAVTAALDVACSSSAWGESFPNVLGEAMACAVPCVTTDVGESAEIVGACGMTVPPRDPNALATAIVALAALDPVERARLGLMARDRIAQDYSIQAIADRYEQYYRRIAEASH